MDVRLRGEMRVDGKAVPSDTRAGLLIAFLCLAPNHRARRERIGAELWPEQERSDQLNSLRQAVHLANKVGKVFGDRTSVWIEIVASDVENFESWSPLLNEWKHPWAERAREVDRQRRSDSALRQSVQVSDPIAKIELLKQAVEADPLDEDLFAELIELYQALGWKTEASIQIRNFDRALREAEVGLTSPKMLGLLRPVQDSSMQNRHGLSRQQNIELTLANFPALFASGQLQPALDSLDAIQLEGDASSEQESKITYFKVRCLLYMGQTSLALETASGYPKAANTAHDQILRGYELYLNKQYVACSEFLLNQAELDNFPDELYCDGMNLLASVAIMSFQPELASRAIDNGIRRASEIGYRYSYLNLRILRMTAGLVSARDDSQISRYDELTDYAQRFGFVLLLSGLLADKGKALRQADRLSEAEETLLEGIATCDRIHYHLGLGIALDYLGETYLSMERYSDAALQFQRSALLRREFGEHIGVATSYRGAGLALIGLKEYKLARTMLRRCLKIYQESGDKLRIGVCCIYLSLAEETLMPAAAEEARRAGILALRECGVDSAGIRYELGEDAWSRVCAELG